MALFNGPNLELLVQGNLGEEHYEELMAMWRGLDALVQPKVLSMFTEVMPVSPADGDCYLISDTIADGEWATNLGKIARYSENISEWEYYTPKPGWTFFSTADNTQYTYDGTSWNYLDIPSIDGLLSGPETSVDLNIPVFDGDSSGLLMDSGISISTDITLASDSDTLVPTEHAVKTYVDDALTGMGSGTVVGPVSSVDQGIALFDGIGGDTLLDSEVVISTDGTFTAESDLKIPTELAVKTYVDDAIAAIPGGGGGSGDVVGPTSSTNLAVVLFDGIGGDTLLDSEVVISTDGTFTAESDFKIPTELAVKTYVDDAISAGGGGGSGDVVGPASSTDSSIALFDGTTGKLLEDSAVTITTDDLLASNSDSKIPTEQAVKSYVDSKVGLAIPVSPKSANYTLVLGDANSLIYHPASDATGRTWTIPANSSVAFPVGTAITFDNDFGAGAIIIVVTTDDLVLVGTDGFTGARTLAPGGQATAIKVTTTRWRIGGVGLS